MIKSIVVVGGGAAGWISAGLLAAKYLANNKQGLSITLIESANIGIVGVGEGTWPTMVNTLKKLGIAENDFLQSCDVSFKQGSQFRQWVNGQANDFYYHPFSLPQGFEQHNLVPQWLDKQEQEPFARAVCLQTTMCEHKLAPKQLNSAEYSSVESHGYHLDAGKFAQFLQHHCTATLGIKHLVDDVVKVNALENGDIGSLTTLQHGELQGDLFIDCSGSRGLLIDKHYQIPFISQKQTLFIDRALAVQVPYSSPDTPIESTTLSTAQQAGWIWDIGLPSRRGVGHVYASKYISRDQAAQQLREYLRPTVSDVDALNFRDLHFEPGHREKFWHRNCVAVGMSAGFIEPLEASALVMVELAATMIAAHLPVDREAMDVVAKNYNQIFLFRWARIIDFLKLHYVLSTREDSAFWRDNKACSSIPQSLQDLLTLWRYQSPCNNGFLSPYDLFPEASYQYILYGMGFQTKASFLGTSDEEMRQAKQLLQQVKDRIHKVIPLLPTHRELLNGLAQQAKEKMLSEKANQRINCIAVDLREFEHLSAFYPLFFKKQDDGQAWSCVALLGFSPQENLFICEGRWDAVYIPQVFSQQSTGQDLQQSQNFVETLHQQGLIEPAKLDITFNDSSSLVFEGLYVINQPQLAKIEHEQQIQFEQQSMVKPIKYMLSSLQNMPKLITKKNHRISQKSSP